MLPSGDEGLFIRPSRPFPLMHVDTTWKFKEMIQFRDETRPSDWGLDLIVHVNERRREARHQSLSTAVLPFHTQVMKTESLKQAAGQIRF